MKTYLRNILASTCLATALVGPAAVARDLPVTVLGATYLGAAYSSKAEKAFGGCVTGTRVYEGAPEANVDFKLVTTQSQLSKELGLSAGGRVRYGVTETTIASNFMKASSETGYSIIMSYSGFYKFRTAIYKDVKANEVGKKALAGTEFEDRCGDEFIKAQDRGAKLFFTIRLDFSSTQERDSFDAELKVKSTMFDAMASVRNKSAKASQKTQVTVGAYQLGGRVEEITGLFGGTRENNQSLGFVQCSLGSFDKCDKMIASAIDYATNRETGFPSQLKNPLLDEQMKKMDVTTDSVIDSGPATINYKTETYRQNGIVSPYPEILKKATLENRKNIETLFERSFKLQNTVNFLIEKGLVIMSPPQMKKVKEEAEKLARNMDRLSKAAVTCYDEVLRCSEAVKSLQSGESSALEPVDEAFLLDIPTETFTQYCIKSLSPVASKDLVMTMKALMFGVDAMKKSDFNRQAITASDIENKTYDDDACSAAEGYLKSRDEFDFSNLGLKSVEPLRMFVHIRKLNVSNNQLQDLNPLKQFQYLSEINLSQNGLRDVSSLAQFSGLATLNIGGNKIRDLKPLLSLSELARLDIRENVYELTCPQMPSLQLCANAGIGLIGEFFEVNDALPRGGVEPAAVDLEDGTVLITGLVSGDKGTFNRAALYNKVSQQFSVVGGMTFSRRGHTATRLDDGRVLIAGGFGTAGKMLEIYDSTQKAFVKIKTELTQPRADHTATKLADGRVLLAGGYQGTGDKWDGRSVGITAEIFDPKDNSVTIVQMRAPRARHQATLLPDHTVLLTGGMGKSGGRTAEVFNPANNSFQWTKSSMQTGRGGHTASLLPNGQVIVVGGFSIDAAPLNSAEIYSPEKGTFRPLIETLKGARGLHTASVLSNGNVLIVGGSMKADGIDNYLTNKEGLLQSAEVFSLIDENFTEIPSKMARPRALHLAIPTSNDAIVFLGGQSTEEEAKQVEMFSYTTQVQAPTQNPGASHDHP